MAELFKSNLSSRRIRPIVREVKEGMLVEVVICHEHGRRSKYSGYVVQINYSELYLSLGHSKNLKKPSTFGPISIELISDYKIYSS